MRARTGLAIAAVLSVVSAAGAIGAMSTARDRGLLTADTSSPTAGAEPARSVERGRDHDHVHGHRAREEPRRRHLLPRRQAAEPAKSEVRRVVAGPAVQPPAFANVYDRGANKLYEAVVDLKTKQLVSWTLRAGRPAGGLRHRVGRRRHARPRLRAAGRRPCSDRGIDPEGRLRRRLGAGRPARPRAAPAGNAPAARDRRSTAARCRTPTTARSRASSSRST